MSARFLFSPALSTGIEYQNSCLILSFLDVEVYLLP